MEIAEGWIDFAMGLEWSWDDFFSDEITLSFRDASGGGKNVEEFQR